MASKFETFLASREKHVATPGDPNRAWQRLALHSLRLEADGAHVDFDICAEAACKLAAMTELLEEIVRDDHGEIPTEWLLKMQELTQS